MKRACCLLLCTTLAGTGCFTLPTLWPDNKPAPAKPVAATPAAPAAPTVLPEQVNDGNAKAMAAALKDELDKDPSPPVGQAPAKPATDGKQP